MSLLMQVKFENYGLNAIPT